MVDCPRFFKKQNPDNRLPGCAFHSNLTHRLELQSCGNVKVVADGFVAKVVKEAS